MKGISIVPVLLVQFVNSLGFSIVYPFLVFLLARFEGGAVMYGLLAATYPALQLVGAPVLGRWSDRHGRRKVLLLSQAGTLLAWCVFLAAFFVPQVALVDTGAALGVVTLPALFLFLARGFDGLTGGNVSVANAYLADISLDEEKSRNYGRMSMVSNLGFVVGPALAGILGATALGEMLPVIAALGVSLVATLVVLIRLPESKKCVLLRQGKMPVGKILGQEITDCVREEADSLSFGDALRVPHVKRMLWLYFLIYLGFNFFYTAFPVHARQTMGWSVAELGAFFSVLSLLMALVQGPVVSVVSRRVSEPALVVIGNLVLAANFVMLTSSSKPLVYGAAVFFAVGNGLMWPSVMSILAKVAGDRYQGAVQGIAGSVGSAAAIAGLVVGGALYAVAGAYVFLASAATLLVVAGLGLGLRDIASRPATAA